MKLLYLFLIFSFCLNSNASVKLFLESGAVWQNRNDIAIPGNSGTEFAIDQFNQGPFFHYRLEGYYEINNNHAIRAVYAPFSLQVSGKFNEVINFNGQSFNTTENVKINYKFNSYRLSYVYAFYGFENNQLNIGFTGKIRDADTELKQGNTRTNYDNVGFVPLFYFEYLNNLTSNWFFHVVIDAAIAPQGRAIDAAFKMRKKFNSESSLGFGLRSLEGGADNEKVFAFSWFNYLVIDYSFSF